MGRRRYHCLRLRCYGVRGWIEQRMGRGRLISIRVDGLIIFWGFAGVGYQAGDAYGLEEGTSFSESPWEWV